MIQPAPRHASTTQHAPRAHGPHPPATGTPARNGEAAANPGHRAEPDIGWT